MDIVSKHTRSRMMAGITGKDTTPELVVRRVLHAAGLRFRLHRKDLPGRPDVVLPRLKTVVLVHGCFWHRHPRCRFATTPASNTEFWSRKFAETIERDARQVRQLKDLGWRVTVVWECETRNVTVIRRIVRRLSRLASRRKEISDRR
jgi:DNA mismatch endonuclease, patch repair protein